MHSSRVSESGFSLIETLVATMLLVVAVVTLAQLFGIAARSNVASRHVTYATVLAAQKLEQLRALDLLEMGRAPAAALRVDTPGWVDYIDRSGRTMEEPIRPRRVAYIRRWSLAPADGGESVWITEVLVRPNTEGGAVQEEVRLVTVRSRRGM